MNDFFKRNQLFFFIGALVLKALDVLTTYYQVGVSGVDAEVNPVIKSIMVSASVPTALFWSFLITFISIMVVLVFKKCHYIFFMLLVVVVNNFYWILK